MSALLGAVRRLLQEAELELAGTPEADQIRNQLQRLDEPLRVAIAGRVKAGKSTLLNALVGEELAMTDAGECTKIVTWYRNSHTYRVSMWMGGQARQIPFRRDGGAIEVDLGPVNFMDVDKLDVEWPSSRLNEITLIDTPGLESATVRPSEKTLTFFSVNDDEGPTDADAVVYLMRHLHNSDMSFLETFRDRHVSQTNPINAVAVLSRADEVGACRSDAMQSARHIAGRYAADPRVRRLVQTVVPVAGLAAQASVTLTEAEYQLLAQLARADKAILDELLLSADRFANDQDAKVDVVPLQRQELLSRLGLYGIRVSVSMIRLGAADTSAKLAAELRQLSGIEVLRDVLTSLFAQRRVPLKARAALAALDQILLDLGPDAPARLVAELERITASTHEFAEVQILNAARSGMLPLTASELAQIDRFLGNPALPLAERLGIEAGDEKNALVGCIDQWRRRAENPMSSRPVVEASQAIIRSYEGALVELATGR